LHLQKKLTRARLEEMIKDLVDRTMEIVKKALEDAKLRPQDIDDVVLVGGSTRIPLVQQRIREFFGKEPHKGVHPDEVVAVGAAIQAGILSGEVKEILLVDVTPLSLGVETYGGVMTVLIPRNTPIPYKKCEIFTTAADYQTEVEIHVLQGERPLAKDNKSLGKFYLTGIPPAPRGVPKIEVCFDIDVDGILHVTAKDLGTGKEQSIRIQPSSGLTQEDIERIIKEAQMHEEEDRRKKELIDAKNQLDMHLYNLEKVLRENRDKLSSDLVSEAERVIQEGKKVFAESQDIDEVRRATERVLDVAGKVGGYIYQSAGKKEGGDGGDVIEGKTL
jgi:molecular chaperone DnaK